MHTDHPKPKKNSGQKKFKFQDIFKTIYNCWLQQVLPKLHQNKQFQTYYFNLLINGYNNKAHKGRVAIPWAKLC